MDCFELKLRIENITLLFKLGDCTTDEVGNRKIEKINLKFQKYFEI